MQCYRFRSMAWKVFTCEKQYYSHLVSAPLSLEPSAAKHCKLALKLSTKGRRDCVDTCRKRPGQILDAAQTDTNKHAPRFRKPALELGLHVSLSCSQAIPRPGLAAARGRSGMPSSVGLRLSLRHFRCCKRIKPESGVDQSGCAPDELNFVRALRCCNFLIVVAIAGSSSSVIKRTISIMNSRSPLAAMMITSAAWRLFPERDGSKSTSFNFDWMHMPTSVC